jgi:hypothetical protein
MKLTLQPGIKFVFTSDDPSWVKLDQEFTFFINAMHLFHNIEFEFHPESSIGWLPPYYIAGDPVWISNQYYRDQMRAYYRHCHKIILWDIGYPEVDYEEVNRMFYDKELVLVTDKLLGDLSFKKIDYDWFWNHFKYYATTDVTDPKSFWNYQDYHMPMLLQEKRIHNVIRYDGDATLALFNVLEQDYGAKITDDFLHTLISVITEEQLNFKTYHAISRGHLPMLLSAPHQIERLGARGFWLSDLFNYDYDKETNLVKRTDMFAESIRRVMAGNTSNHLEQYYLDNLSKLRDNQKLFFDAEYDTSIESLFKN